VISASLLPVSKNTKQHSYNDSLLLHSQLWQ
jgi:hypothetical protein